MDAFQSYAAFVRSFEAGSFSAVARELGISQSAVSKQVAGLEASLGVQLFARTTRKLQPTSEALTLYENARQLLDAVESLRSRRGEQATASGTLRVTAPVVFGRKRICPLLPAFIEQNPYVEVELMLSDETVDLVGEGVELGIRSGRLSASTLMARPLGVMEQFLVAAPKYLSRHRAPDNPADLSEHRCLIYGRHARWRRWEFESDMGRQTVKVSGNMMIDDHETLLDLVRDAHGIALLPDCAVEASIGDGSLEVLMEDFYPIPLPINIVYPQTRFISQRARNFIDFLIARLGSESGR